MSWSGRGSGDCHAERRKLDRLIVCKAHMHAKHANTRESGDMPPEIFEKLYPLNLRAFFSGHRFVTLYNEQNFFYLKPFTQIS